MIIKGQHSSKAPVFQIIFPVVLLLLIFIARSLILSSGKPDKPPEKKSDLVAFCNAEKIKGDVFLNKRQSFLNAHTRSSEKARSGKYSSKLDPDNKEGMAYIITDPEPGATYKADIWSFNQHPLESGLVAASKDKEQFYKISTSAIERDGNWWKRRELIFTIPRDDPPGEVHIYPVMLSGENTIYFDDLRLSRIPSVSVISESFKADVLHLRLDKQGLEALEANRKRSIARGLVYHDESKVDANIMDGENHIDVRIRHKGDWLDHMGKHPSFRIDMKDNDSWNGMQSFSIQVPETRGFLREWVFIEFLNYADVLAPRFDFIHFSKNNEKPVVFAYEEHFDKMLVENRKRREGPIVKMTEDRFWESTYRSMKTLNSLATPEDKIKAFWSSELKAFKEKKIFKNPVLENQFIDAQNLLFQYKYSLEKPSMIFDIDRLAKYMAIVDICKAHHAVTWHNQRFYYNPVTAMLEPIGFDGFGPDDQYLRDHLYPEKVYSRRGDLSEPINQVFYDDEFLEAFFKYYYEYSDHDFIRAFMGGIEQDLSAREEFIQSDYKDYTFNRDEIITRCQQIRKQLIPFPNSVHAFIVNQDKDSAELHILNTNTFPLIIENELNDKLITVFPSASEITPEYTQLTVPSEINTLYYRLPGSDSLYTTAINPYKSPRNSSIHQTLSKFVLSAETPQPFGFSDLSFSAVDDTIIISSPVVIPKNSRLDIKAGTVISFRGNGFILSYSPIYLKGKPDNPIIISGNNTNGSITIMQSPEQSELEHVVFSNQNTLIFEGWKLTGAVNFYESNCKIRSCSFLSNNCEDALNIIRSEFDIQNCEFINSFGDALDVDFSEGKIDDCHFSEISNDAVDFSTSSIQILNSSMKRIGDKAISAGEQSSIIAKNIEIEKANIGVAVKDQSILEIDSLILLDCNTGFTAYQKKPEYGPAKIVLREYAADQVNKLFMIEENSELIEFTDSK